MAAASDATILKLYNYEATTLTQKVPTALLVKFYNMTATLSNISTGSLILSASAYTPQNN